jgi:hypothetical protein
VLQRSIGNFSEYLEGFFEHGTFHGITARTNKLVIDIKSKKWLVHNRVGVTGIRKILKYNDKNNPVDNMICIINGIFHGIFSAL